MKNTEHVSYDKKNDAYGHKVTDYTKDGKCSRCGGCCSQSISMTDAERDAIKKHIRDNGIKPVKRKSDGPYVDFLCPFLTEADEKNPAACSIYDVRPAICKAFRCDMTPAEGLEKLRGDIRQDTDKLKQRNMEQEFFPDEFAIRNGDYVVPLPIACVPDELKEHVIYIAYDDPAGNPDMAVFVPANVPDDKKISSLRPRYEFQKLQR